MIRMIGVHSCCHDHQCIGIYVGNQYKDPNQRVDGPIFSPRSPLPSISRYPQPWYDEDVKSSRSCRNDFA